MRKDVSDKAEVRQYVAKIRDVLDDPRLQDVIERAAAQVPGNAPPRDKISSLLNQDIDSLASSGGGDDGVPYLSRAPLVSMVQSHVEEALTEAGISDAGAPGAGSPGAGSPGAGSPGGWWSRLVRAVKGDLRISPGSFTPDDPDWYVVIARGVLERLAEGNGPFNESPAG